MTNLTNPVNRRRFLQTAAALAAVNVVPARAVVGGPQAKSALDELAGLDALGQAELVRTKKISPLELVDAAIARIEKYDPTLNTIITRTFERARKQASQPVGSGPFAGVPYLVKDLEPVAGVRQTFVPTSTIDWCSSGFTSPSSTCSPLRISVMYDRSSRVCGSMIANSSSMPRV